MIEGKFRLFEEDYDQVVNQGEYIHFGYGCTGKFLGVGFKDGQITVIYEDECEDSAGLNEDEIHEGDYIEKLIGKDKNGDEIWERLVSENIKSALS